MKKLLVGDALRKRAEQLGVIMETDQSVVVPGRGNVPIIADDYELQRRVLEAERHLREHRLWLVAVFSAVASLVSAVAAWLAVIK